MPHTNQILPEKLALRIPEFCRAFGVGRSKFYELVARRELQPRKSGKQTLIPIAEAERWFNSLPLVEPKTPTRRPRRGSSVGSAGEHPKSRRAPILKRTEPPPHG